MVSTEHTTVTVTFFGRKDLHRVDLITDDDEATIAALCPNLPGCFSQGDDRAQALANISEAIKDYLEVGEELRLRHQAELRPVA